MKATPFQASKLRSIKSTLLNLNALRVESDKQRQQVQVTIKVAREQIAKVEGEIHDMSGRGYSSERRFAMEQNFKERILHSEHQIHTANERLAVIAADRLSIDKDYGQVADLLNRLVNQLDGNDRELKEELL